MTIKEYRFPAGSVQADSAGTLSTFAEQSINGKVLSVQDLGNNYTATGSILLFESGLANSGTGLGLLLTRLRAGSMVNSITYPQTFITLPDATVSTSLAEQPNVAAPVRLVGSGLGASTSGLGIVIRYM